MPLYETLSKNPTTYSTYKDHEKFLTNDFQRDMATAGENGTYEMASAMVTRYLKGVPMTHYAADTTKSESAAVRFYIRLSRNNLMRVRLGPEYRFEQRTSITEMTAHMADYFRMVARDTLRLRQKQASEDGVKPSHDYIFGDFDVCNYIRRQAEAFVIQTRGVLFDENPFRSKVGAIQDLRLAAHQISIWTMDYLRTDKGIKFRDGEVVDLAEAVEVKQAPSVAEMKESLAAIRKSLLAGFPAEEDDDKKCCTCGPSAGQADYSDDEDDDCDDDDEDEEEDSDEDSNTS